MTITHQVTKVTTELACRTLPVMAVYDNNTSGDKSDVRAGKSNVTCSRSITHQVTKVTTELACRTLPVVAVSDHNTSGDTRDDRAGMSNVTCGGSIL